MAGILRRNLAMKLLSLVVAMLLWFYVTNEQAPVEQTTMNVRVEAQQLRSDYSLITKLDTVKVSLQGTKNALSSLTDDKIVAYIDLSNVKPGTNEVDVRVKAPAGIKALQINPARLTVNIDVTEKKEVPVKINISGNPAAGYIAGLPKLNPTVVTIKGPARFLKQIAYVTLDLDLGGTQQNLNISRPAKITLKNIDDGVIDINPSDIQVIIPITKDVQTKTVPLKYRLIGDPAAGFKVDTVTLATDKITIQGAKDILDSLEAINLEAIDITGAKSDLQKVVKIVLPDGVKTANGDTVQVVIKIVAKPGSNTMP